MAVLSIAALARQIRAHSRLFAAALIGAAVGVVLPPRWGSVIRLIVGWDTTTTLYLALTWSMMWRETVRGMRGRAQVNDETGWTMLALSAGAALASLGAIFDLLAGFKDLPAPEQAPHLALAAFTILCSWFFLHTLFTLHYAHEFYGPPHKEPGTAKTEQRGGLQFAGQPDPVRYIDFAYFAFTIGMTAQTSDTAVTTRTMRGLSLAHSILTFFFNTIILAFAVNIGASLL